MTGYVRWGPVAVARGHGRPRVYLHLGTRLRIRVL